MKRNLSMPCDISKRLVSCGRSPPVRLAVSFCNPRIILKYTVDAQSHTNICALLFRCGHPSVAIEVQGDLAIETWLLQNDSLYMLNRIRSSQFVPPAVAATGLYVLQSSSPAHQWKPFRRDFVQNMVASSAGRPTLQTNRPAGRAGSEHRARCDLDCFCKSRSAWRGGVSAK